MSKANGMQNNSVSRVRACLLKDQFVSRLDVAKILIGHDSVIKVYICLHGVCLHNTANIVLEL